MDGYVVIGTKLDSENLQKDINKALSDLTKYEKEAEKLTESKAKIQLDLSEYEKEKQAIQESTDARLKLAQTEEQINWVLDEESMQIEQLNQKYSKQFQQLDTINKKIEDNSISQKNLKEKVEEMNNELNKTHGFNMVSKAINNIGSSVSKVTNKIVRWGLAVFGIRSAYMGIRRIISLVSAENEGIANSFQQIRTVFAGVFLPLVQTIVNWIAKLMVYINYIWKFFTGKNLFNFSDATKKASDNLSKGAGSTGKMAKDLEDANKQLAGFDEMNVLQEQSDTSGGGGTGGVGGVGDAGFGNIFDKFKDMPIPKWLQWVLDNGPAIISLLAGIVAGLLALKLGLTPLQSLGIGLIVGGIVYALQNLIKYLKDPSMENFGKIITGIGVALLGLSLIIAGVPAIIGAIVLTLGLLITHWEKIKKFLQGGIDWLKGKSKSIHKILGKVLGSIYDDIVEFLQSSLNNFDSLIKSIKKIFDGLIKIAKGIIKGDWSMVWQGAKDIVVGLLTGLVDAIKLMFDSFILLTKVGLKLAYQLFVELVGSIANIFIGLWNDLKAGAKGLWNGIKSVASSVGNWVNNTVIKPIVNFFAGLWNGIKKGASNTWTGVKNTFKSVASWFQTNVINKIVDKFKTLGTKVGNVIGGAFKGAVNAVLRTIESVLNTPIRAINSMIGTINKLPGVNIGKLGTFSLPRLEVGGIVNQPGRGVPIGGAIAGERGAEGVIPLTDSQQMALLGEAIGKYINIHATVPVYVGNRMVAREIKKINVEDDFAYNR